MLEDNEFEMCACNRMKPILGFIPRTLTEINHIFHLTCVDGIELGDDIFTSPKIIFTMISCDFRQSDVSATSEYLLACRIESWAKIFTYWLCDLMVIIVCVCVCL